MTRTTTRTERIEIAKEAAFLALENAPERELEDGTFARALTPENLLREMQKHEKVTAEIARLAVDQLLADGSLTACRFKNMIPLVIVGEPRSWCWDDGVSISPSVASAPSPASLRYSSPENYERDQWIFRQRQAGKPLQEIIDTLAKLACKEHWMPLESANGVRDALKRYAHFHGLDVPSVPGGRPSSRRKPSRRSK